MLLLGENIISCSRTLIRRYTAGKTLRVVLFVVSISSRLLVSLGEKRGEERKRNEAKMKSPSRCVYLACVYKHRGRPSLATGVASHTWMY